MEFVNEKELQDFLIDFLSSKGHNCYKEYLLASGERVDILTEYYVIECKPKLRRTVLDAAVGQLQRYRKHLPTDRQRQFVVAGLASESARSAAYSHKQSGIEVWFVDEMPELLAYYDELYSITDEEPEYTYSPFSGSYSSSYDDGSGVLGFGIVVLIALIIFGGAAFNQQNSPIRQLHRAAIAWDETTGKIALAELRATGEECNLILADSVEGALYSYGLKGFNEVNAIQAVITQQYPHCVFPPLLHKDQTLQGTM